MSGCILFSSLSFAIATIIDSGSTWGDEWMNARVSRTVRQKPAWNSQNKQHRLTHADSNARSRSGNLEMSLTRAIQLKRSASLIKIYKINRHYHRQAASVLLTQILFVAPLCDGSWWRWLPFLPILLPLVHNHALIPAWLCRFFNSLNPLDAACRFGRSAKDLRISFSRLWNHALPGVFFPRSPRSAKNNDNFLEMMLITTMMPQIRQLNKKTAYVVYSTW